MNKATVGRDGEELAIKFLKRAGYAIIRRNYRSVFGEIDIIAEQEGCMVFIEVKTRASFKYGPPKMAVTEHKKRQISKTALEFINKNKLQGQRARFDVVSIQLIEGKPQIELITNAFDTAY